MAVATVEVSAARYIYSVFLRIQHMSRSKGQAAVRAGMHHTLYYTDEFRSGNVDCNQKRRWKLGEAADYGPTHAVENNGRSVRSDVK